MSKLTKLVNNPSLFFRDSLTKRFVKPARELYYSVNPINELSPTKGANLGKHIPTSSSKKTELQAGKNIKHYRNQLLEFKQFFPVNNINVNDENLWPVFRFAIWRGLRSAWQRNNKSTLIPLKTYISKDWYEIYKRDYHCVSVGELEDSSTDFLFFTNFKGVEQLDISGKIYNRITDPVFEEASKVGSAKKIEIVKGVGGVNINRYHETILLVPPLNRTVGYAAQLNLPMNFHSIFEKLIPDIELTTKDINDVVEWYYRDKELYESILKKLKPRVVFFIGFEFHLALSAAAHNLDIKTVDLQHGLQTGWGPLYKWWEEMPPSGYDTLPTHFGVWGERDKKHLSLEIKSPNHNIIELGYKWIDKQFSLIDGTNNLESVLEKSKNYSLIVLITLQHQGKFPTDIYELITANFIDRSNFPDIKNDEKLVNSNEELVSTEKKLVFADDILWLIRKHPKGKNTAANVFKYHENVLCGAEVDDLYIGEILQHVDYHITSSSTVVIEADYFGVESIIYENGDIAGYENYRAEIDNGLIKRFLSSLEFYQHINQEKIKYKKNSMSSISSIDIKPTLKNLL